MMSRLDIGSTSGARVGSCLAQSASKAPVQTSATLPLASSTIRQPSPFVRVVPSVLGVLPALKRPTVSHLSDSEWLAVNTILSSGAVGQPISANTARRLEIGLRLDRKSTRLNSSHIQKSRMPSSA